MEMKTITPQKTQIEQQNSAHEIARKRSRKRSITIFAVISVLNVALLVLLWTQLLTPSRQALMNQGSVINVGDVNFPLIGKPMVDFTLPSLNDSARTIHLADFKGKPIILNFWASWCDACNQEAPFLVQTWPRLQAQGVVFIGIDGQDVSANALTFEQKYHVNYLNVQDTLNGTTAISYGVTGFPETVFINRQGIVVAKWAGLLDEKGLKLEMAKLGL
jgi:cytochrome c biogenesis protein CcmG/thiol:disulfide interchange protein DsbE